MSGELILGTIKPSGDSSILTIDGNLQADAYLGTVKPHYVTKKWEISSRTEVTDIDLGLSETNAKFVLATVYVYVTGSNNEYAHYLFGYGFPSNNSWGLDYYNCDDQNTYTVMSIYFGALSGWHQYLTIPVKENRMIDVLLADQYDYGTHYIKLRKHGYLE